MTTMNLALLHVMRVTIDGGIVMRPCLINLANLQYIVKAKLSGGGDGVDIQMHDDILSTTMEEFCDFCDKIAGPQSYQLKAAFRE